MTNANTTTEVNTLSDKVEMPKNENERHSALLTIALRWLSDKKKAALCRDLLERIPLNERVLHWRVITGVMQGHEFKGYCHRLPAGVRIVDVNSVGQSYPAQNCIII